ncbi:hypothetical protein ACE1TI_04130 [Alteribacillus sp. JSM 102045]|uniref:hypothetical protein n=1 Tax=Alteribacillus sp. JSM 102045 TaxID=1562101 RepID=UPI0035C0ECF3
MFGIIREAKEQRSSRSGHGSRSGRKKDKTVFKESSWDQEPKEAKRIGHQEGTLELGTGERKAER